MIFKKTFSLLAFLVLLVGLVEAVSFSTTYNPFTGKLDYYNSEITSNSTLWTNASGVATYTGDVSIGGDTTFGGGYGSTGVTIYSNGNLFTNGDILLEGDFITVDGVHMNGSHIPLVDATYDLGNSSNRWRNIYASDDVVINGSILTANTYDLIPASNNSYVFGNDAYRWKNASIVELCLSGDCKTAWPSGGGGTPGGVNTEVQYNDGGSFGGDSGFTYIDTANQIKLGGGIAADTSILFHGNSYDYYVALDDSADSLLIGRGSSVGSNVVVKIKSNGKMYFGGASESGSYNTYRFKGTDTASTMRLEAYSTGGWVGQDFYDAGGTNQIGYFAVNSGRFVLGNLEAGAYMDFTTGNGAGAGRISSSQNWYLGAETNAISRLQVDGDITIGAGTNQDGFAMTDELGNEWCTKVNSSGVLVTSSGVC